MHKIQQLINLRKTSQNSGIYSCCSTNEFVLRAVMERAKIRGDYILIEATANQVNQFGGYTGMKPKDFARYVYNIAENEQFHTDRIILGGDHLGPLTFSNLDEQKAMENARELVSQYVAAGFIKIHIDTSMRVGSDNPSERLHNSVIVRRGANLCATCEEAFSKLKQSNPNAIAPVYVIGSEVPIPGGIREEKETIRVTTPEDAKETLQCYQKAFSDAGIEEAWKRVVALVVQPGVEFGDSALYEYNREAAADLCSLLKGNEYNNLVFEAHSTDYQTKKALRMMVEDGFAILKVGPALTFALREALFSLELMERELDPIYCFKNGTSSLRHILDAEMVRDAKQWKNHYNGSEQQLFFDRAFSFSDRARYYLPKERVLSAVKILINNLQECDIPYSLLSQYMPRQYGKVRSGEIKNTPQELIKDRIGDCIDDYIFAANGTSFPLKTGTITERSDTHHTDCAC